MKVAVSVFKNGVSPRLDIADSLLIYDIDADNGVVKQEETCQLMVEQPIELISILQRKEIKKIICGGCPQFFLRMLVFYGFDVVSGLTGNPGHIVKMLADGKLTNLPSPGPFGRRCKRRGRFRK